MERSAPFKDALLAALKCWGGTGAVRPQKLLINKSGSAEPAAGNTHSLYCGGEYYRKQQHLGKWKEFHFQNKEVTVLQRDGEQTSGASFDAYRISFGL